MRPSLRLLLVLCLVLASCRTDDGPLPPGEAVPIRALDPAPSALRRLTYAQYVATIHDVFGADVTVPPRSGLEPDVDDESHYLAIDSSAVTISRRGVAQYETASYRIAQQALDATHRATTVTCTPAGTSDPVCARATLERLGRRLFRRPMDVADADAATSLTTDAGTQLADFYGGLEFGIAYLLQSPRFLFREELGVDDVAMPGERAYDGYEMASRLAFFLWNAPPDAALLDAAAAGELDTTDGLRPHVARMLDDPRSEDGVRELAYEWFQLADLDDLSKDAQVFTQSSEAGPPAREETLRLLTHLFATDADARDLMTTRETFVDRKLASIYHIPAPRTDWGMVTFPEDSPRAGVLGHISILALQSHPISTSPTLRGRFIRERLLCEPLPHAPVGVNTQIMPPSPSAITLRDRLVEHQQVSYCANCHRRMDPIGLGLEAFDALGTYRAEEEGIAVDASGELDGTPFRDALELGQLIRDDPRFADCMMRQAYRVATGHFETDGERGTMRALTLAFAASGYSLRQLFESIALSDGFRRAIAQP